ncbi:hypothetical protein KKG31_03355 [Patescibacteria group bacterium]|nr:hypothetical protein [Patescibacteria group bacterium]MBU1758185.1 hypothetical protein [Patescibacteria group bacterium]
MEEINKNNDSFDQKNQNLYYYGSLLYNYGKNVFYYKYASDNVRAGKQKFFLPYKSNIKNIYSNECILKFFDENFIATVLQDINPKDIRIFIQNKDILDLFKKKFGKKISALVKKDKKDLIEEIYKPLGVLLHQDKSFSKTLQKHFTDEDIYHLKESVYNIEFRLTQTLYQTLAKDKVDLKKNYSDSVVL